MTLVEAVPTRQSVSGAASDIEQAAATVKPKLGARVSASVRAYGVYRERSRPQCLDRWLGRSHSYFPDPDADEHRRTGRYFRIRVRPRLSASLYPALLPPDSWLLALRPSAKHTTGFSAPQHALAQQAQAGCFTQPVRRANSIRAAPALYSSIGLLGHLAGRAGNASRPSKCVGDVAGG